MKYLYMLLLLAGTTTWAQTKVKAGAHQTDASAQQIDFLHGPTWDVGMVVDDVEGFITARHEWIYAQVDRIFADPTHPLHREAADGTLSVRGSNMPELIHPSALLAYLVTYYSPNDTMKNGLRDKLLGAGFPVNEFDRIPLPDQDRMQAWIDRAQEAASEPFIPAFEPDQPLDDATLNDMLSARALAERTARRDWSVYYLNRFEPRTRIILLKNLSVTQLRMSHCHYPSLKPAQGQRDRVRHVAAYLGKKRHWTASDAWEVDDTVFYHNAGILWASAGFIDQLMTSAPDQVSKAADKLKTDLMRRCARLTAKAGNDHSRSGCEGDWDWTPHHSSEDFSAFLIRSPGIIKARVVGESAGILNEPFFIARTLRLEVESWLRVPRGDLRERYYLVDPHTELSINGIRFCGRNPNVPEYKVGDVLLVLADKPLDQTGSLLVPEPRRVLRLLPNGALEGQGPGVPESYEALIDLVARVPYAQNYLKARVK